LDNEEKYKSIKAEILGEESDDEEGSGSDESSDEEEEPGMYSSLSKKCLYLASRRNHGGN
jgi:hypothetical protein